MSEGKITGMGLGRRDATMYSDGGVVARFPVDTILSIDFTLLEDYEVAVHVQATGGRQPISMTERMSADVAQHLREWWKRVLIQRVGGLPGWLVLEQRRADALAELEKIPIPQSVTVEAGGIVFIP